MTTGDNMGKAKETYSGFITLLKWGTISSAVVAAIVVLIIA